MTLWPIPRTTSHALNRTGHHWFSLFFFFFLQVHTLTDHLNDQIVLVYKKLPEPRGADELRKNSSRCWPTVQLVTHDCQDTGGEIPKDVHCLPL